MGDIHGGTGSLTGIPLAQPSGRGTSLLDGGAAQSRAVRFGSLDPAVLTVIKQSALPLTAVIMLAGCVLMGGQPWSMQCWALALVIFLISARVFSPLELRSHDRFAQRARRSTPRIALEWSCVAAMLWFLKMAFHLQVIQRDVFIAWLLATPLALLLVDSVSAPVSRRLAASRAAAERHVIIGANDVGLELARRIEQSQGGGRFVGFLDYRSAARLPDTSERATMASCSVRDFAEYVRRNSITRVYLALPLSTAPRIQDLLEEHRDTTASVYFVPNLFAFDLVQARCVEIDGLPAFSICDSPLHGMNGLWKRTFDVVLAAIMLLLLWPALLAVAAVIKISSPGPVLFKQHRYGLNGEEILVYKFRSMTVCEDGAVVAQARRHDCRVTPFGAFLRRTSMDELPQIFNVIEGKMSFVGPRPHAIAHNEEYRKLISGYMIRHKVRPGITGWAQVNGLRGETSTVEKMRLRVQYDLDYLENWSMRLDLQIIAKTALRLLRDTNAY